MINKQIPVVNVSYQQGDVLFRKLDALPEGERKTIARGKCILAHGESGHCHVVEDDEAELVQIGERMLLTITKPLPSKHEEHDKDGNKVAIAPGIWEIGRVNEFDYLSQMKRKVID